MLKARLDAITGTSPSPQSSDASHVQDSSGRTSSSQGRPSSDTADTSQHTGTDLTAVSRSGLVSPNKPLVDDIPDPTSQLEASVDPSSNTTTEDVLPPDPAVQPDTSKTYSAVASAGQVSVAGQVSPSPKVSSPSLDTKPSSTSSVSLPKTPMFLALPVRNRGPVRRRNPLPPLLYLQLLGVANVRPHRRPLTRPMQPSRRQRRVAHLPTPLPRRPSSHLRSPHLLVLASLPPSPAWLPSSKLMIHSFQFQLDVITGHVPHVPDPLLLLRPAIAP